MPRSLRLCGGPLLRCGGVGLLAHAAADGSCVRLDVYRSVDRAGAGQPAGRDVRVVGADGSAAVDADGNRTCDETEPGTVETVHRLRLLATAEPASGDAVG